MRLKTQALLFLAVDWVEQGANGAQEAVGLRFARVRIGPTARRPGFIMCEGRLNATSSANQNPEQNKKFRGRQVHFIYSGTT